MDSQKILDLADRLEAFSDKPNECKRLIRESKLAIGNDSILNVRINAIHREIKSHPEFEQGSNRDFIRHPIYNKLKALIQSITGCYLGNRSGKEAAKQIRLTVADMLLGDKQGDKLKKYEACLTHKDSVTQLAAAHLNSWDGKGFKYQVLKAFLDDNLPDATSEDDCKDMLKAMAKYERDAKKRTTNKATN